MSLVQSVLMVTVVRFWVDIDMASTMGMYGLSFVVSLCFFLLNQLLNAGFGPPGRFLALILMVVQLSAAGGTYPIETAPRFMQALHAWLPVTHSVDGMRSLIAGGPFDAAGVLLPLAGWTLASFAGLVAVVLVTWRKVHGARGHGAHDARSGADDGTETAADLESAAITEPAATTEPVETVAVESRE
jgi:putative membrane protein